MRKVNKDFNNPPAELIECAEKNEQDLLQYKKINNNCYKKAGKHLEELYLKKCAYCETKYLETSDTWIEHYRPKSKDNYYWLAYEWSNLILTCTKCNRKKSTQFPLINEEKRVKSPPLSSNKLNKQKCIAGYSELINETPYIVHPELDEPDNYFDFELDDNNNGVKIIGKDIDGRGSITAEICDLNRVDLKLDRQEKVIDNLIEVIDILFLSIIEGTVNKGNFYDLFKLFCKKLELKSKNKTLEHTLFRKTILNPAKFEEIVCPYIKNSEQKEIVIKAFKKAYEN